MAVFQQVVCYKVNIMQLSNKIKEDIIFHAKQCYPNECCGLIVGNEYYPCSNVAKNKNQFEINPIDWAKAEDYAHEKQTTINAIVHSHPDATTKASDLDLMQVELHGLPWVIVSYSELEFADKSDFAVYYPCGYQAPLLGRNYYHGIQDCYSIVRDFYQRELNISLNDFKRDDAWWENKNNPSLYMENFQQEGFFEIDKNQDLKYGDIILCRVGRTEHINHALIWLGEHGHFKSESTEPCTGNMLILHHPYGRKSIREIYGYYWQQRTALIIRHQNFLGETA